MWNPTLKDLRFIGIILIVVVGYCVLAPSRAEAATQQSEMDTVFRPLDDKVPTPGRLIANGPNGPVELTGFEVAKLAPAVQVSILKETAEICAGYLALPDIGSFLRSDTYNNSYILTLYYPKWKRNLRDPRRSEAHEVEQVYRSEVNACRQYFRWLADYRGYLKVETLIEMQEVKYDDGSVEYRPVVRNALLMYLEKPAAFKARMERSYKYCMDFVQIPENDRAIEYRKPMGFLQDPFLQPWMGTTEYRFVPTSFNPRFWHRLEEICRAQMTFSEDFFKWSRPR